MEYTPFTVDQNLAPGASPTPGTFDNNSLMTLLLAGQSLMNKGADISKPLDIATPIASYMKNVSMANFMKQLLAGKQGSQLTTIMKGAADPNVDMKATLGSDGLKVSYGPEHAIMKSFLSGDNPLAVNQSLAPITTQTPTQSPTNSNLGGNVTTFNPFGNQPDTSYNNITAGDLAGLSTQDISTIIGAKQNQDQLRQQSFRDLIDAAYKGAVLNREADAARVDKTYKEALTKQAEAVTTENTPSVDVLVGDKVIRATPKDAIAWTKLNMSDRTDAMKNYEYARSDAGGKFTGTFAEFQRDALTANQKEYNQAVSEGYPKNSFNKWLAWKIKLGAPIFNLEQTVEKQKALDEIKRQSEALAPDLPMKVEKQLSVDKLNWTDPPGVDAVIKNHGVSREVAVKALQQKMVREELNRIITQSFPGATWKAGDGWRTKNGELIRGDI